MLRDACVIIGEKTGGDLASLDVNISISLMTNADKVLTRHCSHVVGEESLTNPLRSCLGGRVAGARPAAAGSVTERQRNLFLRQRAGTQMDLATRPCT